MCWLVGNALRCLKSVPTLETLSSEQDKSLEVLREFSMGIRLVMIELRQYNETGELPIKNGTTGSQPHVCYWGGNRRVYVTGAAVCMEEKGMVMRIGHRDAY